MIEKLSDKEVNKIIKEHLNKIKQQVFTNNESVGKTVIELSVKLGMTPNYSNDFLTYAQRFSKAAENKKRKEQEDLIEELKKKIKSRYNDFIKNQKKIKGHQILNKIGLSIFLKKPEKAIKILKELRYSEDEIINEIKELSAKDNTLSNAKKKHKLVTKIINNLKDEIEDWLLRK